MTPFVPPHKRQAWQALQALAQGPQPHLRELLKSAERNAALHASGAGISIDAILQREADQVSGANQTDVIILTHDTREGTMNGVLAQMQALPTVLAPIIRIRKEELA